MIYKLQPEDLNLAQIIASGRNDIKERAGVRSNKIADVSDYDIHFSGVLGEIAVARLAGVTIDKTFHLNGDAGYDLQINGFTLDIKSRRRCRKDLIIMPGMSDFTADLCILCWVENNMEVEVVGLVSRQRFQQQAQSVTLAGRPRLLMPWRELRPITPI